MYRNEIAAEIQHYGIGEKPAVPAEAVKARMQGDTLVVDVTVNGQTLTLRSEIQYPKNQQPPYALMLGTSGISLPRQLFADRPIATMTFHEKQVNDYGHRQCRFGSPGGSIYEQRLRGEAASLCNRV